jgi:hypothetical protein
MIDGVVEFLVIMEVTIHAMIVTIQDILSHINGKIALLYVVCFFKIVSVKYFFLLQIDKRSWGYIRTSNINDYLSIQELLNQIITTVRLLCFSYLNNS